MKLAYGCTKIAATALTISFSIALVKLVKDFNCTYYDGGGGQGLFTDANVIVRTWEAYDLRPFQGSNLGPGPPINLSIKFLRIGSSV